MSDASIQILNRLLAIHCRSLPQYLRWSRPYAPAGRSHSLEALAAIARDQDGMAERITHAIADAGANPHTGEFPMQFTDLHDLDLDFMIATAERCQEQDVETIAALVAAADQSPAVKALAEESLGMAKGHLDTLRELSQPAGAA